jgi:hypothetical protein
MNDPNTLRDTDRLDPAVARQLDLDDGGDPWAAWDDVGGEG